MGQWRGLTVPELPRGVYLSADHYGPGFWIRANVKIRQGRYMNLVDIWKDSGKEKWMVDFWKGHDWVLAPNACKTEQEALDYAVAMLWLGEVDYILDEENVDVRHED